MLSADSGSVSSGAIGFPGGVPIFPSTDALETSSFKVVVGSWRRINPATSTASDFTVDVAAYAPKTPFVTRVQLVDVDVPNTQQLIEAAWSRLYFQQGITPSLSCRSLEVTLNGADIISAVLPLAIDTVSVLATTPTLGITRVFVKHQAPWPMPAVAETWKCLPGGQGLRVFGLPSFPSGFLLTKENTRCAGAGTLAFDVVSFEFADAAEAANHGDDGPLLCCLCAAAIPGPSFLAAILSRILPEALKLSLPVAAGGGGDDACLSPRFWQMQFQYSTTEDRFSLYTRFPRSVETACLSGQLTEYMGFGSVFALDIPFHEVRSRQMLAPGTRFHPKDAYAKLDSDSPRAEIEIAKNVQRAFNAYNWEAFRFGVRFPGSAVVEVCVPGGRMTLRQLAETMTEVLHAFCITASLICSDDGGKSGIRFEHPEKVYALDFSIDAAFKPSRIGYSRVPFPASRTHYPNRAAVHVPLPSAECLPPVCDIKVLYNEDTQHVSLHSVPFTEFAAVMTRSARHSNVFTIDTEEALRHGLQPAARLVIAFSASTAQCTAVVVHANSLTSFDVLLLEAGSELPDGPLSVTVVPQDRLSINLFLQALNTREKPVFPPMIGFQPLTYEGLFDLLSPGTLDMRQDPYLLLCLSFQAEDASAQCGNVYYPFENNSQLIFGKILRSTCTYKADYDRAFFYEFKGTGIHLGYIRVRILNSDGTPYESHGHPASVCLRFDVKQSGVALGGPGAVQPPDIARAPLTLYHKSGGR